MKNILILCLMIFSISAVAETINIKCWSGNFVMYNKNVDGKYVNIFDDGSIVIQTRKNEDVIFADCIISTIRKNHSKY